MSSFSEGQTHLLMDALEGAGFMPADVTRLGQFGDKAGLLGLVRGTHELKLVERRWREENGVIYLTVVSDGTTGEEWIIRLERRGFQLSRWAKDILRSLDFQPTTGITYRVGVIKGETFTDQDRVSQTIRVNAVNRAMVLPHPEIACLIRDAFSDEEIAAMGLWAIVVMHESIKDAVGGPGLLGAGRDGVGRWLVAYFGESGNKWRRGNGFAFLLGK